MGPALVVREGPGALRGDGGGLLASLPGQVQGAFDTVDCDRESVQIPLSPLHLAGPDEPMDHQNRDDVVVVFVDVDHVVLPFHTLILPASNPSRILH